jgi:hypothetical protein
MQADRRGANAVPVEKVRPPATTAACVGVVVPSRCSSGGWVGKPVADAEDGQNKSRRPRVRLDLLSDVLDVSVDRTLVRLEGHASDSIQQLRTSEHPARLPRHRGQQLKLSLRQIDAAAPDSGFHSRYVELDV